MIIFKVEVKNETAAQRLSLQSELNIMSDSWKRYGPIIKVNGKVPKVNYNQQAPSNKQTYWQQNRRRPGRKRLTQE